MRASVAVGIHFVVDPAVSGQLPEARRFLDKTKQFAETQDEFRFRALCTRALGEVAFLKSRIRN